MKNAIVKTLLALAATFTLGAHATSPVADVPMIQVSVGGGMPMPGGLAFRKVTVNRTGRAWNSTFH